MASGRTNQFFYSSFSYAYEEIIDRGIFYRYFQQDIPQSELLQLSRSLFGEKEKKQLVRRRSIMSS